MGMWIRYCVSTQLVGDITVNKRLTVKGVGINKYFQMNFFKEK